MRKRMKDDELRFRHAAREMEGADLAAIAQRARVPMHRARSLFKRWRGASGLELPPLPKADEGDSEPPAATASPTEPPGPSDESGAAVAAQEVPTIGPEPEE